MSPAPLLLLAAAVAAPALNREKDRWVGTVVCLTTASPETFRRLEDGTFEHQRVSIRYLDMRCVDEQGEHIAVQHDDVVFWVKKEVALRPRDAIDHYTAVIDKNPTNQRAISCRCWAHMALGEYDRALRDAEEAVRLNPNSTAWKNNRGEVFLKRKEYDKAIAEFTDILNASPRYFFALYNRSEAYLRTRQFEKAKADVEAALPTSPQVPGLHMNLARVLATAPDPKLRDGKKAVEAAQKAVEMLKYRDGRYLDTLAAAYAEAGEFDQAVETQRKALDDPEFMKKEGDAARKRLELYRQKKPFRDE